MADLAAKLDAMHAWLNAHPGVPWGECDGVKLPQAVPLIAQPASVPRELPPSPEDPADAELRDLETLLLSSGGDPTMFLRATRAA